MVGVLLMATQTTNKQIEALEYKIAQNQVRLQALKAREKEKARKYRTRRLIQIGALAEKYFNCEGIEPSDFEEVLRKLLQQKSE